MKRKLSSIFLLLFVFILPFSVQAADMLVPVGTLVGLEIRSGTVTVAAFDDLYGTNAKAAGLRIGDEVCSVNGKPITEADQVSKALENSTGTATLGVRRGSKTMTLEIQPRRQNGQPLLGVYLRQGITGIGTVTWYDPSSNTFGALGHGVSTGKDCLLPLKSGSIYPAQPVAAQMGKSGTPGLLKGKATSEIPLGTITRNTPQGILGKCAQSFPGRALPVGSWESLRTGSATILASVREGPPKEYSVEILKLYPKDRQTYRNMLLKVTDPELLKCTGGIVQGMSGSPILQDGKLIGAVTHVLVNDPTCGYGIFIENMLQAG